eukprot:CCRYP_013609-RA/>CCRYP_013609-RA protein AED:0.32 eAED:0.38 QI:0/0/0/1/1/1/2/0/1158
MRYEEVETVLPEDFKSTPEECPTDASAVTAPASNTTRSTDASNTGRSRGRSRSKESRRTMIERLRGSWRSRRKKIKSKSRKNRAGKEGEEGDGSSATKSKIPNIRKVDSNATEVRSNTTKALMKKMAEEEREEGAETVQSLPSIREGSGTPNTEATASHEENEAVGAENVPVPSLVENFSVEVGDEVDNVEVGMVRSPSMSKPVETAEDTAATDAADANPKLVDETSTALVPVDASALVVRSKEEPVVVEDVDENESCSDKQVAILTLPKTANGPRSDPMSNLAQKVNDALDVVGSDAALVDEAKGLDDIGDNKVEEERDYDENPTKLFMYLQQRAWGLAMERLKKNPEEAKVWVYRKQAPKPAENVKDGYKSQALTVQSQALVPHEGGDSSNKLRWKLLPLHASIVLGAPPEIIMDIIKVYPSAARKPDERGSLPVHLAASRLDVDPEGEKVVLHLFGAYPDSIQMQDRKGRTPQELAKLARMRKEAEEQRRLNASQEVPGIEKTASSFRHDIEDEEIATTAGEDDDDCSVKSGISARFKMMLKKSKSTDTHDRRRKKEKKTKSASSSSSVCSLSKARSADDVEPDEMGPGFAILKPTKEYEARVKSANANPHSLVDDDDDDEEGTAANKKDLASFYSTPPQAPSSTDVARSIPLPKSFSNCDDEASVKSSTSAKSTGSKASVKSTGSKSSVRSTGSKSSVRSTGSKSKSSKVASVDEPLSPVAEKEPETPDSEHAVNEVAEETDDATDVQQVEQRNESLLLLLEKAAENVGRGAEDVTEYLKDLEDEWVTDVEALRRLDGETLDAILPIVLSREVQRLMSHADNIDNKFLTADKENGKWVRSDRGRDIARRSRKKAKRAARKSRKLSGQSGGPQDEMSLNAIEEEPSDDDAQTIYSIRTEAPPAAPVQSHANSTVRIHEAPTKVKEFKSEEPSEVDSELEIRKLHANLIADARKKFPTRESLEDAIRERQQEVEAAVNSGFDVDKQTLSRAALADDEVRRLLPLRLILPSIHDLNEMIGVLQIHKENALRNTNFKKAKRLQGEIDELQNQLDLEKQYVLKRKLELATAGSKCITCGESFTPETKMVGILKTKEYKCPKCRTPSFMSSLLNTGSPKSITSNTSSVKTEEAKKEEPVAEKSEIKTEVGAASTTDAKRD